MCKEKEEEDLHTQKIPRESSSFWAKTVCYDPLTWHSTVGNYLNKIICKTYKTKEHLSWAVMFPFGWVRKLGRTNGKGSERVKSFRPKSQSSQWKIIQYLSKHSRKNNPLWKQKKKWKPEIIVTSQEMKNWFLFMNLGCKKQWGEPTTTTQKESSHSITRLTVRSQKLVKE